MKKEKVSKLEIKKHLHENRIDFGNSEVAMFSMKYWLIKLNSNIKEFEKTVSLQRKLEMCDYFFGYAREMLCKNFNKNYNFTVWFGCS